MTLPPLPPDYVRAIKNQLGTNADAFLASYDQPPTAGLRINPAKISLAGLHELTGWNLEPIPWCETGAYIDPAARAGAHPYHAAGLYYLQEPSAMAVAEVAAIEPGMTVLDLAAAPGGKSTQIATAIGPGGLLVANEIHPGRIKPLGENLERWGATRTVITNADPARLRNIGPAFDRVIVDAPCSGEGLFRREPEARLEWSVARMSGSAGRQREILTAALGLVRPGGALVYSTCTFNELENEHVVAAVLGGWADFRVEEQLRLWPHRIRGEGHAIVLLRRHGDPAGGSALIRPDKSDPTALDAWLGFAETTFDRDPLADDMPGSWHWQGDRMMLATGHDLDLIGIPVVRDGLWVGERKPGRFEPSHALALAVKADAARNRLDLDAAAATRWIAGEPLSASGDPGWVLVTIDGFPLGWGKRSSSVVKNHYTKGLRRQA
jgi:16S rRNA C967 or C1407 C5-methylase (RsmB/RsmF family)/NOL1/NOP2/fmu family ribosome biogenesis protein